MKLRIGMAAIALASLLGAADQPKEVERVNDAATVFDEVMGIKERSIPQELLDKSECVIVVPGLKSAAFIIGGKYGKGVISCRPQSGEGWSAPFTVRIEGGSIGLQLGGKETDYVMLVMNQRGVDKLLQSKFTLGADISVAGGPVGREADAQTDAQMHAEMLAYSRSRGLFAGVSINGATMRPDQADNRLIFGKPVTGKEVLRDGTVKAPGAVQKLIDTLNKYSSRKKA